MTRCNGYTHARLAAWLLGAVLVTAPALAPAHGPEAKAVKARLDPLSATLAGINAQVQTTVAPQLVVANDSPRTLEIFDQEGRVFLRINEQGVLADLASPAWYRSQTAARGVPIPEGASQDAEPRWALVHKEPNWGWFDPRLRTDDIEVPHDMEHAGKPGAISAWSVPVRLDGKESSLAGQFRYEPLPPGSFQSRLTSNPEPVKGVTVGLAPGTVPAVHIHNQSGKPVVVADADGRPHLRIGPGGSFVNANRDEGEPNWVKVAGGSRYTWTEPRATYGELRPPETVSQAGRRAQVATWALPVTVDGEPVAVKGVVDWLPGEQVAAGGGHH